MTDIFCKQLKTRSLLSEEDHSYIRAMLQWDTHNPYAAPMATFYLGAGHTLAGKMVEAGADWAETARRNAEIVQLIKDGKMAEATLSYGSMLVEYMDRYWPDCRHPLWIAAVKRYREAADRLAHHETVEGIWPACSDGPPPAHP